MIETAARGAQFLLAIGIAYLIAVWFALVAWTFRDIEARSRSVFAQVFSTLLVVLFFIPGLLLYLILRPKETLDQAFQRALEEEYLLQDLDDLPLCPGCQRSVDPEFVLCPHCQTTLRSPCPACSRLIDLRWHVCPYCAVPWTALKWLVQLEATPCASSKMPDRADAACGYRGGSAHRNRTGRARCLYRRTFWDARPSCGGSGAVIWTFASDDLGRRAGAIPARFSNENLLYPRH